MSLAGKYIAFGFLSAVVILFQIWNDEYLQWNDTIGIQYLIFQSSEIWTPDIMIANA